MGKSTEKGSAEKPSNTDHHPANPSFQSNHGGRWKIVAILLFVGVVAVNIYVWQGKYPVDLQTRYEAGFRIGYSEGNQTGYDRGYQQGNQSGYMIGYTTGNEAGYQTGLTTGLSDGYDAGYDAGYLQGVDDGAGHGYVIRDPTLGEALHFLAMDPTDTNEYTDTYQCRHFTADVKNHAFEAGYRCGYVYIGFQDGAHAIICFETIDEGVIFIEPQDDSIVQVIVGQPYWDRTKYNPTYNDTIVEYVITW
jgi:hypothetical protein